MKEITVKIITLKSMKRTKMAVVMKMKKIINMGWILLVNL
jgi:hypothetical protein